jgi:hypothetical protein
MVSTGWIQISISKLISNINVVLRHNYISKPDPLVYKPMVKGRQILG